MSLNPQADAAWTVFDPNLRIDVYPNGITDTVVITHLPTGMQEAEAKSDSRIVNRMRAMIKLKNRVIVTEPILDGEPLIIGIFKDVYLGVRYTIEDMARDCGCSDCLAMLASWSHGGTGAAPTDH